MNRRRWLLSVSVLLSALQAHAQGTRPKNRIGWLSPVEAEPANTLDIFRTKFRELGHVEGRDFAIESRHADGRPERLPGLARELVAMKPAVILTFSSAAVAALQKATASIPVVFGSAGNPDELGFVKSLARPGGNITGASLRIATNGKLLDLIRDCLPGARRIVILEHETDLVAKRNADRFLRDVANTRYEASVVWVKDAEGLERAIAEAAARKAEAVIVPTLSMFAMQSAKFGELALKTRLPVFTHIRQIAVNGGLLSYTPDISENFRRAAILVDKILRGANPGDLPVEQPDRYVLTVNLRTAKALGITIAPAVVLRADEVIE